MNNQPLNNDLIQKVLDHISQKNWINLIKYVDNVSFQTHCPQANFHKLNPYI
jgi:hypothetical protein